VSVDTDSTIVPLPKSAAGPAFVYANADDYAYALVLPDARTVTWLERNISSVQDSFLRAMLWGTLWDQVRNFRMEPERFVWLARNQLAAESDEQIIPFVLARVERALLAYIRPGPDDRIQSEVEQLVWTGAVDYRKPYGIRKAYLDAFVALARSSHAIPTLDGVYTGKFDDGEPIKDPTRWDIVTRQLELGAPEAEHRLAEQIARDTTPDGRRRAFIAQAARPSAENKREYFTRYFAESALNEDWASGSLNAFNSLEHQALTLPYLRPALDSLPFIQRNRRIFYLESWLGAFLRGQTNDSALAVVRRYLTDNPKLPQDLRRKVLQHMDELERTVRIRQSGRGSPAAN
jgi:aminopeptidase N